MTVLAVAEHRRGDLRDVTYEVISAGQDLAEDTGSDLHVAVIGGDVESFAEDCNRDGVDVVHTVDEGAEFNHDVTLESLVAIADGCDPSHIVAPNSVNGLDYAPAVAERLDWPLITDAVGLSVDDGLTVTREFYGGKTEGELDVAGEHAMVTIRPTEWPPAEGVGDADIEAVDSPVSIDDVGTTVSGFEEVAGGDVDISEADVLVSVGRGIEEEENLEIVEGLADALDATLSASRPIVDNEWLPKNRQVGQSGKVVTPDVYLAIGISGAVQHVAGMKGSDTIIAINTDPNAPIFDVADYGIVDDLFEVVPELSDEFAG
jgi:electron transfer flavoprotein alpha subunit